MSNASKRIVSPYYDYFRKLGHAFREVEARAKPRGGREGIGRDKGPETSEAGSRVEKRGWWQRGVWWRSIQSQSI